MNVAEAAKVMLDLAKAGHGDLPVMIAHVDGPVVTLDLIRNFRVVRDAAGPTGVVVERSTDPVPVLLSPKP